jgi:hypothetical protein
MSPVSYLIFGAVAMATAASGLIFLRSWRDSRDRFFLFFALSFFVQALNRVLVALEPTPQEASPWHYGVRFVAYTLIVLAILDKNRPARAPAATCRATDLEE